MLGSREFEKFEKGVAGVKRLGLIELGQTNKTLADKQNKPFNSCTCN